jgi:transposase
MRMVLTDAQWAVLEPLIEACRPHRKNGAKWRAVPAEYGPWWMAAQCFIRWGKHGVWERLLSLVQEKDVRLGMVFLDGSNIRAHQKAAGAVTKGDLEPDAIRVRLLADHVVAMAPRPV